MCLPGSRAYYVELKILVSHAIERERNHSNGMQNINTLTHYSTYIGGTFQLIGEKPNPPIPASLSMESIQRLNFPRDVLVS